MKFRLTKFILLSAALSTGGYAFAESTAPITDADVSEINDASEPELSSSEQVEIAIEDYFERKGVTEGVIGKGGKVYYQAVVRVSVKPASPAWAKSRQIAFEKALLKAQASYIFDNFGRNVLESEQKIESDNSSNAREFKDKKVSKTQIGSLYDKVVALGQAKLDALLEEAGVDPSEYSATPKAERKQLYLNSYIKTSLQRAMGASSGLLPVQTFEGTDGNGNHSVGVAMMRSDKLQQLASDMSQQREPFMTAKKGKPLSAYIDHPAELLANQFGVRVMFNEEGRPQVLSYGQWGYGYKGKSDSQRDRERSHAAEMADTVAVDALTTFMNSRISFSKESTTGEAISDVLTKQGDEITEEDVIVTIDKMNKNIKQTASAKLAGTRTVKRWKYKHPYGHEIVGRVKIWSMDGVEQAKSIASFKPAKQKRKANPEDATQPERSGVRSGLSFDDEEEAF